MSNNINRRDLLKAMSTLPLLGFMGFGALQKRNLVKKEEEIRNISNISDIPLKMPAPISNEIIKIGIIGIGLRGNLLLRSLGFASDRWLNKTYTEYKEYHEQVRQLFLEQDKLNVEIVGICDLFDLKAEEAIESCSSGKKRKPKRYKTYQELIDKSGADAVIIATNDAWHAPIAIYAANAKKHIYCEKCMTHKITETYELKKAVENNNVILQVGHQNRQNPSLMVARELIKKRTIGHVSLIEATTNRNTEDGAWQYDMYPESANEKTVDWRQYLGKYEYTPFNPEHFFRWRKYWKFGSGLTGDLLTHEYDFANFVFNLGIPKSVTTSGGVYIHRDGREVPDVMQVSLEYPDYHFGSSQQNGTNKGLTFLYSSTLGNSHRRGLRFFGNDGMIDVGKSLSVFPDAKSKTYKDLFAKKLVDRNKPMFSFVPSDKKIDAVTSATASYFAGRGLLHTQVGKKKYDSTHLHLREWLHAIRDGGKASCDINAGFEESITAHMATLSYKTGRKVEWNSKSQKIIVPGFENDELDATLIS